MNNDIVNIRIEENTSAENNDDETDLPQKEKSGILSALFRRLYKGSAQK
ncbi:hypothetical protein [Limnobaculum xujianqingii]|nr:hypothetical protein [Limnobaculum xujianqingii]